MPRPRRPHRASPDEIKITRDGDYAIIAYADDGVATTHLQMGSERLAGMTDEQILEFWNDGIDARDDFMAEQELIAIEMPMGKPQLKYEQRSYQWVPRGHVVKGVILGGDGDDIDDECVTLDGKDLTIREFVRTPGEFTCSWPAASRCSSSSASSLSRTPLRAARPISAPYRPASAFSSNVFR